MTLSSRVRRRSRRTATIVTALALISGGVAGTSTSPAEAATSITLDGASASP